MHDVRSRHPVGTGTGTGPVIRGAGGLFAAERPPFSEKQSFTRKPFELTEKILPIKASAFQLLD